MAVADVSKVSKWVNLYSPFNGNVSNVLSTISAGIKMFLESAWKVRLMWFVENVLAVSFRHEGRRTKMLVGHSLSCCTEGNLVDLEWRSADCGAPWRRRPVRIARQDTAVQSRVNTWTPSWTLAVIIACRATINHLKSVFACKGSDSWWSLPLKQLLPDDVISQVHFALTPVFRFACFLFETFTMGLNYHHAMQNLLNGQ